MDRCEDIIDHRPLARDDCPAKSPSRSVPARMRFHCPSIRPPALSKMKFLHCLRAARVGRRPRGSFARVQCARSRRRCSARPAHNFPPLHPSLFLPRSRAACSLASPHLRIFLASQGYSTSSTFSVETHSFRLFLSWVIENGRSVHSARPRFVGD